MFTISHHIKPNRYIICFLFCLICFSGCATRKPQVDLIPGVDRPKIALVLGGGAARGFAHVGVIRTLEKEKIPIDLIIGISVGSVVGAIYADTANSFELEWEAFALEKDDIFDFSIFNATKGPVKGDKLEKFVLAHIKTKLIEDFKIPFIAVAVDLNKGEEVLIDKGSVAKAVRASSSLPGIFEPLEYMDRLLVDGGVLGNIAPTVAKDRGADIVITVDIGKSMDNYNTNNVVSITLQAINIMSNAITGYRKHETDVLISPEVGEVDMMDFSQKKKCMIAGMNAAGRNIWKINALINEWGKRK